MGKGPELSQSGENTEPQSNVSDATVQVADILDETNKLVIHVRKLAKIRRMLPPTGKRMLV